MPDQDDRAVDGRGHRADGRGIAGQAAQGVGRSHRVIPRPGQLAEHAAEPGRVRERPVDENRRRPFHAPTPLRISSSLARGAPASP